MLFEITRGFVLLKINILTPSVQSKKIIGLFHFIPTIQSLVQGFIFTDRIINIIRSKKAQIIYD